LSVNNCLRFVPKLSTALKVLCGFAGLCGEPHYAHFTSRRRAATEDKSVPCLAERGADDMQMFGFELVPKCHVAETRILLNGVDASPATTSKHFELTAIISVRPTT
jgi:hypothetical protein